MSLLQEFQKNPRAFGKYFDHTALKADTTARDIDELLKGVIRVGAASVCVNPQWINHCVEQLKHTDIMTITVVGFPLGASGQEAKIFETRLAIAKGAREIDMVLAVGLLKSGDHDGVRREIIAVKKACGEKPLKVIFETSLLNTDEIQMVARWCAEDGIDFVKTSTGFGSRGASVEDIRTMKVAIDQVGGAATQIKASGGIRTLKDALSMIEAGASRLGTSATESIVGELVFPNAP